MTENPLQKYYRQPKVYLSLPSKGKWYPENTIEGDPENLPVFGMTAMDEILFKTPDALFSGEATKSVIKSCIPGIKEPGYVPQIDIDSILIAIRIATYGQNLNTTYKCTSCNEENTAAMDLTGALDYYSGLNYHNIVYLDPLKITLRPYTYDEWTQVQMQTYELQRHLLQTSGDMDEEVRKKHLDEMFKKISRFQLESYKRQVFTVEADDNVVSDQNQILDWINNSDAVFFEKIQNHLIEQQKIWALQDQMSECVECGHNNSVTINLDQSDFFVKQL